MPVQTHLRTIESNPFTAKAYDSGGLNFSNIGEQLDANQAAKKQAPIDSLKAAEDFATEMSVTNQGQTEKLINEYKEWVSSTYRGVAKTDKNGQERKNRKGEVKFKSGNLNSPENRLKDAEFKAKLAKTIANGRRMNESFQQGYTDANTLPSYYNKTGFKTGLGKLINSDLIDYDPEWQQNLLDENYSFEEHIKQIKSDASKASFTEIREEGSLYAPVTTTYSPEFQSEEGGKLSPRVADGMFDNLMKHPNFSKRIEGFAQERIEEINTLKERGETLSAEDEAFDKMGLPDKYKTTIQESINASESEKMGTVKQVKVNTPRASALRAKKLKENLSHWAKKLKANDPDSLLTFYNKDTMVANSLKYSSDGKYILYTQKARMDAKTLEEFGEIKIKIPISSVMLSEKAVKDLQKENGKNEGFTIEEQIAQEDKEIEEENTDPAKLFEEEE